MSTRLPALAAALLIAAMSGCGGSDSGSDSGADKPTTTAVSGDERSILETIDAFQSATKRSDGSAICEQVFTPNLARSIATASGQSCPDEVTAKLQPDEAISVERGVQIAGSTATATIREQNGRVSTLHMLKIANRWRIDRITPQGAN